MSGKMCRHCGSPVTGKLESIALKLLCKGCYTEYDLGCKHSGLRYIVLEKQSLERFGLESEDLKCLRYMKLHQSGANRPSLVKYYLRGEICYVGQFRSLLRKERLEQETNVVLNTLDSKKQNVLLGDFLTEISHPMMSFKLAKLRCKVFDQVVETLKQNPLENSEAVFQFFMESPAAGPDDYEHMKRSMVVVFETMGDRILHNLSVKDRQKLKCTPLAEILSNFEKRDRVEYSIQEKPKRNASPGSTVHADRVTHGLKGFWDERLQRKAKLDQALNEKGVFLAEESDSYRNFLNEEKTGDIKNAIAFSDLCSRLKRYGIDIDSSKGKAAQQTMFYNLNVLQNEHDFSVKRGIASALASTCSNE